MSTEDRWLEAWQQHDRLLRIARRRVPTREDAEDVVAEAIQRAGAQEDLPVSAIPAWVTRVTINLCIDRQRRLATQRAALHRAELRPEAVPTHEEEVLARAEAVWLAGKIVDLPPRQALAVRLRADGVSTGDIAVRLGLSQASVDGLLKRSRSALRQALQAAGALVAAMWGAASYGRRPTAVKLASLTVLLALLPWSLGPGAPADPASSPPPAVRTQPFVVAPAQPGAVRADLARRAAPSSAGAAAGSPYSPPAGQGEAVPYEGPRCLVAYCLPIVDQVADQSLGATSPRGWSPANLQHYLGEPVSSRSAAARRPLVAVISWRAFDWVTADLDVYRRTFRLPPCDEADGCLRVLRADASDSPDEAASAGALGAAHQAVPRTAGLAYQSNPAAEQAQMLQGVSAVCPECRLALVIAESTALADLTAAFRTAQSIGPDVVVTNLDQVVTSDRDFRPLLDPGLYDGALVVAAGGVGGFGPGHGALPRRHSNVVSVGGTVVQDGLVVADHDNGSFCNRTMAQPVWQRHHDTGCRGRAGMDLVMPGGSGTALSTIGPSGTPGVSAGLSIYVSGGLSDGRGWYHPGHTTQAVAVFGGLFARHGLARLVRGPADLYAHPEWFADIVAGSTDCMRTGCNYDGDQPGVTCSPTARQLCDARRGWDGATGLGEPRYLPWA